MKKAFDANVSKAKPRLRLGTALQEPGEDTALGAVDVEAIARHVADEPVSPGLSEVVQARVEALAERPSAAEALRQALSLAPPRPSAGGAVATGRERPVVARGSPEAAERTRAAAGAPDVETVRAPEHEHASEPTARGDQHAPSPGSPATPRGLAPSQGLGPEALSPAQRRERLKQRLRSVRENPRPDPLPETVAEAGVFAVERIAGLQSELTKARAVNLALTQELEASRRQAERATEEARVRMDEARRLSEELEGRAKLLTELEGELKALEAERDEVILAVQEARQALQRLETEKRELQDAFTKKEQELVDSLAEEERLAGELEAAQEATTSLRRSSDLLKTECDTLSRQVADLMRERVELLEARKALEAVHRALSKAATF